jgi:hypothetical protein
VGAAPAGFFLFCRSDRPLLDSSTRKFAALRASAALNLYCDNRTITNAGVGCYQFKRAVGLNLDVNNVFKEPQRLYRYVLDRIRSKLPAPAQSYRDTWDEDALHALSRTVRRNSSAGASR